MTTIGITSAARAPAPPRGEAPTWIAALAVALGLHAILSTVWPDTGWTTSAGIGLVNLVALARCLDKAARADAALGRQWLLLGTAFLLWIGAFAALAWLQTVRHDDMAFASADSLLFTLRGAPLLLLVAGTGGRGSPRAFRLIDAAQVALFAVLALALLFPDRVGGGGAPVTEARSLAYHEAQNYGLALFALLALALQTAPEERRFHALLAWLLASYAVTASIVNHLVILRWAPPPGSPLLMAADLPQAGFVLLSLLGRRGGGAAETAADAGAIAAGARLLQPMLFGLALLTLAFLVAREHFALGLAAGSLALLLHGLRSTCTQLVLLRSQRDLGRARDRLAALAAIDPLTRLANRRAFDERLGAEWRRLRRTAEPLAILLIDVDRFKSLNDVAGHLAGDQCLRVIATAMERHVRREGDMLARYGGEEFVVIAPFTDLGGALVLAETLRAAVVEAACPHPGSRSGVVTVSIGAAALSPSATGATAERLVALADQALYRAKAAGRNRVAPAEG